MKELKMDCGCVVTIGDHAQVLAHWFCDKHEKQRKDAD